MVTHIAGPTTSNLCLKTSLFEDDVISPNCEMRSGN